MISRGQIRTAYEWVYDHRILLLLLLIFTTGFLLRAFPVQTGMQYWDETVYLQHGEILAGERVDTYNEFDFRPPLLSLLLGGVFSVTDSLVAAHVLVSLLAALGIPIIYLIGTRLYNRWTGIIAGLIYTLSPLHITASHTILIDPILATVWLCVAWFTVCLHQDQTMRYAVLAGGSVGVAVLAKFTSLVLFPLIPLLLVLYQAEQGWNLSLSGFFTTVRATLEQRHVWLYTGAFLITVSPYLLWSHLSYGNPLHPFMRGMLLSGAATPFHTYAASIPDFIAAPFLLGLILFIPQFKQLQRPHVYLPLFFILVLVVPMQFMIENREPRYLLPIVPFLAVYAAAGFAQIRHTQRLKAHQMAALIAILAVAVFLFNPLLTTYATAAVTGSFTAHEPYTPTYDAAQWLRDNTADDTLVYTNYEWPILAYYSRRPIQFMPVGRPFQDDIGTWLEEPGYVFVTDRAPDHYDPDPAFLRDDPRFTRVATFGNDTYVFHYSPYS